MQEEGKRRDKSTAYTHVSSSNPSCAPTAPQRPWREERTRPLALGLGPGSDWNAATWAGWYFYSFFSFLMCSARLMGCVWGRLL
ncbi:hypothetical protein BDW42DRAFT_176218 [Aspergillus taichungensis]|uniref:Uncharacterized protein n=1 Tax=Aspergillus taichungensis TaxID=482145 RepID=A0A2J5HL52_9EURO|nr:hypothetical protein BDW42DRAFT_176218 [Aspergillus taichungensis]